MKNKKSTLQHGKLPTATLCAMRNITITSSKAGVRSANLQGTHADVPAVGAYLRAHRSIADLTMLPSPPEHLMSWSRGRSSLCLRRPLINIV
jgi:hypothetical protein